MRVILESPFKSNDPKIFFENMLYVNMVARHLTIEKGMCPLFFHTFYTQFLDDSNDNERALGLDASFHHHDRINTRIIAVDRGLSSGMKLGTEYGLEIGCMPVLFSLSESESIQSWVRDINENPCPIGRWKQIEAFCEELKPVDDLGNYTDYAASNLELREEVCDILKRTFAPLNEHL